MIEIRSRAGGRERSETAPSEGSRSSGLTPWRGVVQQRGNNSGDEPEAELAGDEGDDEGFRA